VRPLVGQNLRFDFGRGEPDQSVVPPKSTFLKKAGSLHEKFPGCCYAHIKVPPDSAIERIPHMSPYPSAGNRRVGKSSTKIVGESPTHFPPAIIPLASIRSSGCGGKENR
jgi:hypothetical protein